MALARGDDTTAERELQIVLTEDSRDLEMLDLRGQLAWVRGETDEACETYRQIADLAGEGSRWRMVAARNRGRILAETEDAVAARDAMLEALAEADALFAQGGVALAGLLDIDDCLTSLGDLELASGERTRLWPVTAAWRTFANDSPRNPAPAPCLPSNSPSTTVASAIWSWPRATARKRSAAIAASSHCSKRQNRNCPGTLLHSARVPTSCSSSAISNLPREIPQQHSIDTGPTSTFANGC